MDVFTVVGAIAALIAVCIAVFLFVSQPTSRSSPWPKIKQILAYTQNVVPKKITKLYMSGCSLDDFIPVGEVTAVHDVARFFAHHGSKFSVYTIDWAQEVLVLIRHVDGVDLKAGPIFFVAQKRSATEVLCIPLEKLQAVATAVADKVANVQKIFIFLTGRCGSTLMTRLVESTSVAQAVSEPHVFTDICMALHQLKQSSQRGQSPIPRSCPTVLSSKEFTIALLRNLCTVMNYNLLMSDPRCRDVIFYKLKMDVILMADLIAGAFPSAKTIFMYRNGLEFTESLARLYFQRYVVYWAISSVECLRLWNWSGDFPDSTRCFGDNPKYSTVRHRGTISFYLYTWWAGVMQCAVDLQKKQPGYFFHAVIDYSALVNNKEKTFHLLMKKLGLRWSPEDPGEDKDKMKNALIKDSQAGTVLSAKQRSPGGRWAPDVSSRWTGPWEREYIGEVCRHAGNDITGPGFLLPGTIL
ncbi:Hypp2798 [Branchiostoma lanceolatum]|uniref:Hypp2798 protein n=1 Tax=Branchiostoma lanceolatum TaxID=7740 RepID=A0A8K0ERR4_BRALA|nr:Hypp2798 [Branchiostoma lanceolatum]